MRIATTAVVCALGPSLASVAAAEPTAKQLDERAAALRDKLKGEHLTVLVEAPFVVVGDGGEKVVTHVTRGFLHDKVKLLEQDFFAKRPDKLIEIWIFQNEKSYRRGAKKFFDDTPDTPFGYYSPSANALIMNANGLGTLSHELVHPYMEANIPDVPSWFNEGLASLYEYPGERKGHIIGHVNWRLPNLKKQIRANTLPPLAKLLATTRDGFYDAEWDAYAQARYLMYYLQEHDKLHDFYTKFHDGDKDRTGKAALEAVLGEKLDDFDQKWRKWVLALKADE